MNITIKFEVGDGVIAAVREGDNIVVSTPIIALEAGLNTSVDFSKLYQETNYEF